MNVPVVAGVPAVSSQGSLMQIRKKDVPAG